ncbi:MAG: viperin family antiviral radical SAM protein [Acinetobacter sp.]
MTNLVINWHITEACNYQCFYCFAKWRKDEYKELIHTEENILKLMKEISLLPAILNNREGTSFTGVRLNLVGGEIFLYKQKILKIIKEAKNYQFELSAITNGSLIDNNLIDLLANNFSSIGFSIDSLSPDINKNIGRSTKKVPVNPEDILSKIKKLKSSNPMLDIKINTVVNELNKLETLDDFIREAAPSKWKIFKMLPVYTNKFSITDGDFYNYIDRLSEFNNIISSENNEEMTESYLMIDPIGRFFQNSPNNNGYLYSQSILEDGIEFALSEINFDIKKFAKRSKLINSISV